MFPTGKVIRGWYEFVLSYDSLLDFHSLSETWLAECRSTKPAEKCSVHGIPNSTLHLLSHFLKYGDPSCYAQVEHGCRNS